MSKDISQYLHYYLGCEIKAANNGSMTYTLNKIGANGFASFKDKNGFDVWLGEGWKPMLRKLSSITDDEIKELIGWERASKIYLNVSYEKHRNCIEIIYDVDAGDEGTYRHAHFINFREFEPTHFHYLLSRGFWLFGNDWFDEGLIINKSTLK